jgi:glycosyltransferase involved in cell wall biosynthesis
MSNIAVTVLFATYNGEKTLPAMLEALCSTTLPADKWKLVAVDNNSNDGTAAVLESYRGRLPLDVHFEPRQGKEHALATGFLHLEGELLILTDDDVIPQPDWLEQWLAVADEQPGYDIFGGLILPEWERQPEPWLLQLPYLDILFALNDRVDEGPVPAGLIFGPNSAFRRSILGQGYAVHDNLGPNAAIAQYPMGQDTAFALRLERAGARAFHSRRPRLRHVIRSNSLDENWVLRRAERYGMGKAALHPEYFARKRMLAGVPVTTALRWLAMVPVAALLKVLPRSQVRFGLLWRQAERQGILRQFRSEHRRLAATATGNTVRVTATGS